MKMKRNLRLIPIFFLFATETVFSFAPTNFLRFDDPVFSRPFKCNYFSCGLTVETGSIHNSSKEHEYHRNVLNLCECTQSVLSMLRNPVCRAKDEGAQEVLDQLTTGQGGPSTDDGRRGHVEMSADFAQTNIQLYGYGTVKILKIPGYFSLGFHLPFVSKQVKNFNYCDLTQGVFITDLLLQNFIKNLNDQTIKYGDLKLGNWKGSGLGDALIMFDWKASYRQPKNFMHRYMLFAKIGVSLPTSKEKNENQVLSMPLGNDGAFGLPFGVAFTLDFTKYLRTGLAADFLYLFKKSRVRRLKTDAAQTDLLLLNKGHATKHFGLTWQCEAFMQLFNFFRGLSLKVTYQYIQHQHDRLSTCDQNFDDTIINTACNLREWRLHNALFHVQYDFNRECKRVIPHIGFFYKLPFSARRVIAPQTFGGYVGVVF